MITPDNTMTFDFLISIHQDPDSGKFQAFTMKWGKTFMSTEWFDDVSDAMTDLARKVAPHMQDKFDRRMSTRKVAR